MTDMKKPLAEWTPVEIDTELSRLWGEQEQAEAHRLSLVISLHKAVGDEPRRVRGASGPIFNLSPEHVWEQAIVKAYAPGVGSKAREEAEEIQRVLSRWALVSRKLEDLTAEIKPYVDEYVRRGRWNRVFLAQSHDGHAHNGTECSTCHRGEERTRFAWLVRYSGKTEAEIVADAGWRACTTCYPSAPVGDDKTLPTKMYTPDEEEARKARAEREAARAAKKKAAEDKKILAPDGSKLKDEHGWEIKTLSEAERKAVDLLDDDHQMRLIWEPIYREFPGLRDAEVLKDETEDQRRERVAHAIRIMEAIAAKKGVAFSEVAADLNGKAERRAKRDRSSAPRNAYQVVRGLPQYREYVAKAEAAGHPVWKY